MGISGKFKGYFLSMVLVAVLLAVFVVALDIIPMDSSPLTANPQFFNLSVNSTQNPLGWTNYNFSNVSGTVFFNVTLQGLNNITNVTFSLLNVQNGSIDINVTVLNSSLFINASGSRVSFNFTLDTTGLPDGTYNVTFTVQNLSIPPAANSGNRTILNFVAETISVDNTPPNLTSQRINMTTPGWDNSSNITSLGVERFFINVTYNDTRSQSGGSLISKLINMTVETVIVGIRNINNGTETNVTALKNEWTWGINLTPSRLNDGLYVFWFYANDSIGNRIANESNFSIFVDRNPPNVTQIIFGNLTDGQNLSNSYVPRGNNFLVTNLSVVVNDSYLISRVIVNFNFTNNSGTVNTGALEGSNNPGLIPARANTSMGVVWNATNISIFNLSALEEGHYFITVLANDSNGHRNTTQNFSFTIDRTVPTVSVSCTSVEVGATSTCTCTNSDAMSGVSDARFDSEDAARGTVTQSVSAGSSTGSFTSGTCIVNDFAGNQKTATGTYTVTAASNGGGGSGGAGGGSSTGATGQFEKKIWTSIDAGEVATVSVKNGVLGVTEVSFSVPSTVWGAWVQVSKRTALPKSVTSFTGKVYRNLEITKGPALKDELLKEAKVEFKVEKAWLSENKLLKESVALHRYKDGAWTQLTTRVAQEDEAYVHYTADTPGFSYFVIGEKAESAAPVAEAPVAEAPVEAPVAEAPAEEAPVVAELKKLDATGWVVALVAAVVIVAAVLVYLKKRR